MIKGYWMILGHHIFRQTCEQSVGQRWAKQESLVSVSVPWDADQPPGSTVGAPSSCQVRGRWLVMGRQPKAPKESAPVLRNQGNGNYWPLICKRLKDQRDPKGLRWWNPWVFRVQTDCRELSFGEAFEVDCRKPAEATRLPHSCWYFFQYSEKNAKSQKDTCFFWKPFASVSWDGLIWTGKIMLNSQVLDPWRNIPEPERLRPPNEGQACFQSIAADSTTVLAQVLTTCATSINFPCLWISLGRHWLV